MTTLDGALRGLGHLPFGVGAPIERRRLPNPIRRPLPRPYRPLYSGAMPPITALLASLALLGALLVVGGATWMRAMGADPARARRLAGARGMAVADVLDLTEAPARPVRISGRIRCADPLVTPDDERLVAYHRDVAVRLPGARWRTIERLRETRSFELWDHAGSLGLDPADAAEPLITIPLVWEGGPDELVDPHAIAVDRLTEQLGALPTAARAVTRTISVVDPLLVLAEVRIGPNGTASGTTRRRLSHLVAGARRAMRVLGGPRRRLLVVAMGTLAGGAVLLAGGLLGVLVTWLLG